MKKLLSILLSLVLVIAALPLAAVESDAATILTSQDGLWKYYVNADNTTITINSGGSSKAYLGNDTDITIPSTIDGYTVDSVGAYAFYNCNTIESITVPNTVLSIGDRAFQGCSGVTQFNMGSSVTSLAIACFAYMSSLTDFVIGSSVQTIANDVFYGCSKLESITLPPSVQSIGNSAFYGCSSLNAVHISDLEAWCNIDYYYLGNNACPLQNGHNLYLNGTLLTDIVVPSTVTQIKNSAFCGCSMKSIVIPEGVTSIGYVAFWGCTELESITIPSTLTSVADSDIFLHCDKLNAVKISDVAAWCSIPFPANINANPLYYGHNLYVNNVLSTVTIPNAVTSIKPFSFAGLSNDIIIPSSVTTIENNAFRSSSMQSVTLSEGLQSIGNYAFFENRNLESINLPDSLTSLGNCAFMRCSSLASAHIGSGLTTINSQAFYEAGLESLTIPYTVLTVGDSAFCGCGKMASLDMGNGLKTIGNSAFAGMTAIENIVIGSSVETIGDRAFNGCSNLKSVTVPPSIRSIGNSAFLSCNSMNAVHISDLEAWCDIDYYYLGNYACPLQTGHNLYLNGTLLTDIVVPSTVTKIKDSVFCGCSMKSIIIPEGVTSIGYVAFWGCTELESITIPSTVTSFANSDIFLHCDKLNAVNISDVAAWCNINFPTNLNANPLSYGHNLYVNNVLDTVTVPNTVTNIKPYTFVGLANDVVIPSSVTTIGERAFYKGQMQSVTLNEGLQSIGNYAFAENNILQSIDLPDSLTSLGNYAFYNCSSLKSAEIGSGLSTVSSYAFGHSGLESITLPDTVLTLSEGAFNSCNSLTDIDMGSGLKTIGNGAFAYLSSLEILVIGSSVETVGRFVFAHCSNLKSVTVPASVKSIDYQAFYGCTSLNAVHISDLEAWCNIDFYYTGNESCPLEYARNLYLNGELLTEIVVPDTVTELKNSTFCGCAMNRIKIPDGVTSIGNVEFYDCRNLDYLVIPASVTNIGTTYPFYNCTSLQHYFCFIGTRGDTYWTNSSTKYYMGDMNSDKVFDINDIGAILSASVDSLNMTEVQEIVADYNLDGVIDGFDAAEVDRYVYSINTAKGDVNQDGNTDLADYAMTKAHISGVAVDNNTPANLLDKSYLTAEYDSIKDNYPNGTIITQQYYCADYDGDKAVDAFDLFYIDKRINNIA